VVVWFYLNCKYVSAAKELISLLALVTAQLLLCDPLAVGFGEFANSVFQLQMPEVYLENMATNRKF